MKRPLMRVMLCFDSLFVAMNCILGHLFGLKEIYLFGGEKFFELITYPLFYIHYGIVMMLALFCLISLFYGAFKAPIFYRRKYMLIAVVMLILVVLNFFTLTTAIDVSVIGYAAEGVCIYYCAFVYTPNRLMSKTVFQVTDNMTVGLHYYVVQTIRYECCYRRSGNGRTVTFPYTDGMRYYSGILFFKTNSGGTI